ncbi:MAG: hypothetical protein WBA10_19555 [Elainellaceae cyanobacterium]
MPSGRSLDRISLTATYLSGAFLLTSDLRGSENLTAEQFTGDRPPLLCNVALPSYLTGLDPDHDCDQMPQALSDRLNIPLEQAQQIVDEACQRQWD